MNLLFFFYIVQLESQHGLLHHVPILFDPQEAKLRQLRFLKRRSGENRVRLLICSGLPPKSNSQLLRLVLLVAYLCCRYGSKNRSSAIHCQP